MQEVNIMLYRYETHCHANLCSRCAHSTPEEMVRAYKNAGFAGLVLTDHFIHGYNCVDPNLPWAERMLCYHNAYLQAKAEGDKLDFDVIFGIEHAHGGGQEVLVYGIDLEFLLAHPEIEAANLKEFSALVHAAGGLVIQAHPYRYGGWEVPVRLDLVDGIEVYNAGDRAEDGDRLALTVARLTGCLMTSGSDFHRVNSVNFAKAGIVFSRRVRDSLDFVDALHKDVCGYLVDRNIVPQIREQDLP
jgi:predicted metal-dependent phosphoesterase TrpH